MQDMLSVDSVVLEYSDSYYVRLSVLYVRPRTTEGGCLLAPVVEAGRWFYVVAPNPNHRAHLGAELMGSVWLVEPTVEDRSR